MKRIALGCFLIVFFLVSCSYEKQEVKKFKLENPKIILETYDKLSNLEIINDFIVYTNSSDSTSFVHVLNKNTLTTEACGLTIGDRPEYLRGIGYVGFSQKYNSFFILDYGSTNFYIFNIDSFIKYPNKLSKNRFNIPDMPYVSYRPHLINDTSVLFPTVNEKMFVVRTPSTLNSFGDKKEFLLNMDKINVDLGYYQLTTLATISPDGSKIAVASYSFDELAVYNSEFKMLDKYNGDKSIEPKNYQRPNVPDDPDAYSIISSDSDFIYALYYGTIPIVVPQYGVPYSIPPTKLRIFSWNLELIAELYFEKPFGYFAIDRDNNKIYGLAYDYTGIISYNFDFNQLK